MPHATPALALSELHRTEVRGSRLMWVGVALFLISLVGTVATVAHATVSPYLAPEAIVVGGAIALRGFWVREHARNLSLPSPAAT